MANFDYRKAIKENKATFHASLTEGQFSWMTQDTEQQIGSEPENTIPVYMFDNKGKSYYEKEYNGYGEFGGKDYYDLVAEMNGYTKDDAYELGGTFKDLRGIGIKLAFGELEPKNGGPVLFPALIADPSMFNYKTHDFTQEAENDPNQSWYTPGGDYPDYEEDEDDNYSWEDQYGDDEEELEEGPQGPKTANLSLANAAKKVYQYIKSNGFKVAMVLNGKKIGDPQPQFILQGGNDMTGDYLSVQAPQAPKEMLDKLAKDIMASFKFLKMGPTAQGAFRLYVDPKANVTENVTSKNKMKVSEFKAKIKEMIMAEMGENPEDPYDGPGGKWLEEASDEVMKGMNSLVDQRDFKMMLAGVDGVISSLKKEGFKDKDIADYIVDSVERKFGFTIRGLQEAEKINETNNPRVWKMFDLIRDNMDDSQFLQELIAAMDTDEAIANLGHIIQMWDLDGGLYEAKDEEVDTEEEVDIDVEEPTPSDEPVGDGGISVSQNADADLTGVEKEVQDNLEAAMEAAKKLGDEKLQKQIGNSLTFFTRQHVVKEDLNESMFPMLKKILK